jgi:hypothetical protein
MSISKLAGHVARAGKRRFAYRVFEEKPDEKRELSIPGRRCKDNIKTGPQEI